MSHFVTIAVLSMLSVLGLLLMPIRVPWRKLFGFPLLLDFLVSSLLVLMFWGTLNGMLIALMGGLIFTIFLRISRWIVGFQTPKLEKGKLKWIDHFH